MATVSAEERTKDDDDALLVFDTYEEFTNERLKINYENTLKIWYSLPTVLPSDQDLRVKKHSSLQQRARIGKISLFGLYCTMFKRTSLRDNIRNKGCQLWHKTLNISGSRHASLFELYRSVRQTTISFLDKAQRYDPAINHDELFKATRLVWCMVAFQAQLDRSLVFSDSMLGYNMLYPYTDDLVDCNEVSREAKKDFARIFHERLLIGEPSYDPKAHFDGRQSKPDDLHLPPSLQPFADRVGKIFDMVKFIENDWIRNDENDGVYMSLATIHECQMKSTQQHARPDDGYVPTMAKIEEISAQKGGASLIVAGYLIEGQLTRGKLAYLEFLGFGLQLLDDLQDVDEDMKNNHRTIFTQTIADGRTLDEPTARLIQLFYSVPPGAKYPDHYDPKLNIQDDMTVPQYIHASMVTFGVVLILEAASHLQRYYSKEFYRELSTLSPVKLRNLKRVHIEQRMWSVLRRQWF